MKQETKLAIGKFAINLVIFFIAWGLISWLVEGNGWLNFILATLFSNMVQDKVDIEEKIKQLRQQLDIVDGQLIFISQQVERFVEKENDWDEIAPLKDRVDDLEADRH